MSRTTSFVLRGIAIGSLIGLLLLPASAATIVWDGGGANDNIDTLQNWNPETAVPGSADDVQFAGLVRTTPAMNVANTFRTVTFNAGADPFTIGGASTLSLAALTTTSSRTIINNISSNTQTFTCPVNIGGSYSTTYTVTIAATSGDIVFNGPFSYGYSDSRPRIYFGGAKNVYLNGQITANFPASTISEIQYSGTGTLFITADQTNWDPYIRINSGTVRLNSTNNFSGSGKILEWASGTNTSKLELDGSLGDISIYKGMTYSAHTSANVQLVSLAGNNTLTGAMTLYNTLTSATTTYFSFQVNSGKLTLSNSSMVFRTNTENYDQNLQLLGNGDGDLNVSLPAHTNAAKVFNVIKTGGTGKWTFNTANYNNGDTVIDTGTIALGPSGSIDYSRSISVASGATFDVSARALGYTLGTASLNQKLGGSGAVTGKIAAGTYGFIVPGGLNAAGTLTMNGTIGDPTALDLQAGATLDFDFANATTPGGGVNDMIQVNGDLTIGGSTSVAINLLNGYLSAGNYRMFTYTGTLTGSAASLSLLGAPVTRQVLTFNHDSLNKYINMNVVGNSANLVWKGGGAGNPDAWNLNTTANFLNGVSMDKFYDLDHVLFNDTDSAHPVVALTGTLQPASLTVNATVDYTFGGTGKISGLTGLNKLGTGKLTLANTGGSDFVGTVAIGGGTLQIGDGANYYSGSIGSGNVVDDGALVFDIVDDRTFANLITGTGSVEKKNTYSAPVTLTVTGSNSYSGPTTVSGGTLKVGNAAALGSADAGTVVLAGGTLDTNGFNLGLETITISGTGVNSLGAFVNTGADQLTTIRTLTLAADAYTGGYFRWDLRGGAPVLDLAGHTMTHVGSNLCYVVDGSVTDGNITVNSGIFAFARSTVTGTGTLTANPGGALEVYGITNPANFTRDIVLNGGNLRSYGGTGGYSTINSNVTLTADSNIDSARLLTLNGTVSGNYKLTKIGAENLILPANNAQWTGGTVINEAILQIGVGGTAGTLPTGDISGDVGLTGVLGVNRSDAVNVSNLLTGSVGFRQMGTGATTLSNAANDYTGVTTIANGVLQVTHDKGLGDATGATSIFGDAVNPRLELIGGGGSLTLGDQLLLAGHGAVQGVNLQPHVVNVSGNNTWTGAVDINEVGGWDFVLTSEGGKLTVTGAVTNKIPSTTSTLNRYLDLGGAAQGEISGVISSDAGVTAAPLFVHKVGTGTWTLSGANTYTGDTVVKAGTLAIAATGSIAASPRIEVYGNATLDVAAFAPFTLASGQVLTSGAGANVGNVTGSIADASGTAILPGGLSTAGTLGISGNLTITGSGKAIFDLGATTTVGGGVNDLIAVGGDLNVSAPMALDIAPIAPLATGTYRLMNYVGTLNNPGNLSLNNATRYAMTIDLATAGQVNVAVSGSNASLLWVGDGVGNVWDVNTTSNWDNAGSPDKFYQADVVTFNDTSANTTVDVSTVVSPGGTITVAANSNYTFGGTGSIIGPAGIAKSGTGTLALNTANAFVGTVTVTDGVLKVGNANALGSTAGGTVVSGTGALDLNDQLLPQYEVVTISGAGYNGEGAIVNTAGGGASANNIKNIVMAADASIGGAIRWNLKDSPGGFQGNGFTLTKVGPNSIVIDDVGDMGVGDINVNEGILYIYQNTTMGLPNKTVTIANNATLSLFANPAALEHDKVMVIDATGGRVYVSSGNATYVGNATFNGAGNMEITTDNDLTFKGNIAGNGGLLKNGAGDLILTGTNTYAGGTTLNAGAIILNSTTGYAIPAGNVVFTAAARLHLDNGEENGGQPQVHPSTVLIFSDTGSSQYLELGGHSITLEGLEMPNYATTSDARVAIENWNETTPVPLGVLTINSQNDHVYRGIIRDNVSPLGIVKRGPGTQAFWGTRTGEHTGGVTVVEGTLDYSNGALPTKTFTVTGGNLKIGDRSQTIGQFQITGGLVEATTGKLTSNLDFDIQAGTVQAALAGTAVTVGLNKSGAGTATLTGALLYTGDTTVYGGTLNATAIATPAATVWVGTGGTLNAPSIAAGSLIIGGTPAAAAAAVPEPGALALLILAAMVTVAAYLRRR
ncbi:MAG: autotransporter-associated beta strand repeat-containing protein [Pirellulales bacterium]|nr:autotransporter-associated beta strand repeat-containing protein [Pirellulales bacterium]